jgi:hypothetical protein
MKATEKRTTIMKFEQNKITLYLGIGYLILALVSLFNLLQPNVLAGLTVAGLFFSLSLLGLAIENTLVDKKQLSSFATENNTPSTLEKLQTVRELIYKTPRHTDLFKWVHIGSGVCFMLGFIFLVALPGFPLSDGALSKISSFSYVASIGSIFIAFYLEERQSEKTQKDGEQEIIDYLFDQIESELEQSKQETNPNGTEIIFDAEKQASHEQPAIEQHPLKSAFSDFINAQQEKRAAKAKPDFSLEEKAKELEFEPEETNPEKTEPIQVSPVQEQPAAPEEAAPVKEEAKEIAIQQEPSIEVKTEEKPEEIKTEETQPEATLEPVNEPETKPASENESESNSNDSVIA